MQKRNWENLSPARDVGGGHTSAVAGGLAASSPLTWHVVFRFTGAGRDHIEDLGRAAAGRAIGAFCETTIHPWCYCIGNVLSVLFRVCPAVGAFQCWKTKYWTLDITLTEHVNWTLLLWQVLNIVVFVPNLPHLAQSGHLRERKKILLYPWCFYCFCKLNNTYTYSVLDITIIYKA